MGASLNKEPVMAEIVEYFEGTGLTEDVLNGIKKHGKELKKQIEETAIGQDILDALNANNLNADVKAFLDEYVKGKKIPLPRKMYQIIKQEDYYNEIKDSSSSDTGDEAQAVTHEFQVLDAYDDEIAEGKYSKALKKVVNWTHIKNLQEFLGTEFAKSERFDSSYSNYKNKTDEEVMEELCRDYNSLRVSFKAWKQFMKTRTLKKRNELREKYQQNVESFMWFWAGTLIHAKLTADDLAKLFPFSDHDTWAGSWCFVNQTFRDIIQRCEKQYQEDFLKWKTNEARIKYGIYESPEEPSSSSDWQEGSARRRLLNRLLRATA